MTDFLTVDWTTLPAPVDDRLAEHLPGRPLPSVAVRSTEGGELELSRLVGTMVLYAYPMTGRPGTPLPDGWDMIPGARGCTPQSCSFRDHFAELRSLGVDHVFGLSTQDTDEQEEAAARLHLPFPLLSDRELALTFALRLPTFAVAGRTLLKRVTLVVRDARIVKVFYPVFPPDQNAAAVIAWLRQG